MRVQHTRRAPHAFQFNVAQLLKQPNGTRRVYDIDTADGPPLELLDLPYAFSVDEG